MTDRKSFVEICEHSMRFLFIVMVPIACIVTLLSNPLVLLIYDNEFLHSVDILCILIWTLVPYSITVVMGHALVASNNQKIDLLVNGISLLGNVILNLVLIPKFGSTGAAFATLCSIILYMVLQFSFINFKNLFDIDFRKLLKKPIYCAGLMVLVMWLTKDMQVAIAVPLSLTAYGLALVALKTLSEKEKLFLKEKGSALYHRLLGH